MAVSARTEAPAALELVRELQRACPRPQGPWHPGADRIAVVFADFDRALELIEGSAVAQAQLTAVIEGSAPSLLPAEAPPAVAEAWHRLALLDRPEGRHPWLDLIEPTLEAMTAALAALAAVPEAAARF